MSEEIKKEVQDTELSLEELGGVAGGAGKGPIECPKCGSDNVAAVLGGGFKECFDCGYKADNLAPGQVRCPSCGKAQMFAFTCKYCGATIIEKGSGTTLS